MNLNLYVKLNFIEIEEIKVPIKGNTDSLNDFDINSSIFGSEVSKFQYRYF